MGTGPIWLRTGALLTGAASLLHVGIILGGPEVLVVEHPYAHELRGRMPFMVVSSLVCLALGGCFAHGAAWLWRRTRRRSGRGDSAWSPTATAFRGR